MALMCSNLHLLLISPPISKSAAASMPSTSSSSSTSPISFFVSRRMANERVKTQRPAAMLRMGPEEEKLTRRKPLDFPIYVLGRELGCGEFGITYLCTDRKTRETLACKSISKKKLRTAVDVKDVQREVAIMSGTAVDVRLLK